MQFILGLVTALVFFAVYQYGYKKGSGNKVTPIEVDEEQQKRLKQFNEDFQSIMNYDVSTAMQRKKVT